MVYTGVRSQQAILWVGALENERSWSFKTVVQTMPDKLEYMLSFVNFYSSTNALAGKVGMNIHVYIIVLTK